jgi:hypothetical protein
MLSINYCIIQLQPSHLWRKLVRTDHILTSSRKLRPIINRSVTSYDDQSELAWDLVSSAKLVWLIWLRKVWVLCSPPSCSLFSVKMLTGFTCIHTRASVVNTDVVPRARGYTENNNTVFWPITSNISLKKRVTDNCDFRSVQRETRVERDLSLI